jgi:hypothetical protein
MQGAGLVVENTVATNTSTRVRAGASGWWRTNGDSWGAAGYAGLRGFLDLEWHPSATTTVHSGYQFDTRRFDELSELNQREHTVFGSVLTNIQATRTTLVGEMTSGVKTYDAAPDSGGLTARQVTLLGRVAQNVTDTTGISLQYVQRFAFGRVPPALVLTPPLFFDDGVYDDSFASDARTWRVGATRVLGSAGSIDVAVSGARKDYRDFPALDLDGIPVAGGGYRLDTIQRAGITWTLPVLRGRTGPVGVELNLGYGFTDHQSTDLFYNYTSHALALGMTLAY